MSYTGWGVSGERGFEHQFNRGKFNYVRSEFSFSISNTLTVNPGVGNRKV